MILSLFLVKDIVFIFNCRHNSVGSYLFIYVYFCCALNQYNLFVYNIVAYKNDIEN